MALSNTLFLVLSLFLANTVHSQVPESTSFQIDSFKPWSDGLTYERDASVPSGSSYLRLIPGDGSGKPRRSSVGRVLHTSPIKLWDDQGRQASFETTISLRVTPVSNTPADGMTFFIIPVGSTIPTNGQGGNLGIYNAVTAGSPIFSIQFDTFVNPGEDPNYRHIGIDINSRKSRNTTSFQTLIGKTVTARINYDALTGSITVVATSGSESAAVSYVYNLKTLLPQEVHVGLSASTGPTNVAFFDVFSWHFTSEMVSSLPDVTSFQIDSFNPHSDDLTYERDAFVPSGPQRSLHLVGTGESGSVGRVLYSTPVKFWDEGRQASFETSIRFLVTQTKSNPADGMTFFIVPVKSTTPTGGEGRNLGIFSAVTDGSPVFAVEFDTFVNSDDPHFRHIGIDINSRVSRNVSNFNNAIGQIVSARINYDAPTRRISVYATYGSRISEVVYVYDLKTLLPEQVQVGLSASTGDNVAIFEVFSWYFTSTMVADNNNGDAYIKQYVE